MNKLSECVHDICINIIFSLLLLSFYFKLLSFLLLLGMSLYLLILVLYWIVDSFNWNHSRYTLFGLNHFGIDPFPLLYVFNFFKLLLMDDMRGLVSGPPNFNGLCYFLLEIYQQWYFVSDWGWVDVPYALVYDWCCQT